MSRLEKLSISGIRSFNPKESGVIIFNTPLTLIVGENGTGKTTIIESLKYATTGNFPPNTKGGAFLYDPAIAGQIDTKAEIKLRFINNSDKHISCCRILQVFQRGGKQVQKTLETNLYQETGDDGAFLISTKLTEIDQLIPEHLGVSQPLLDSVIFCHQEESTWPIGEPRVLKEKLDLIFDSAKYIKAHKSLKDTKKTIGSDIKLKTQSLEYLLKEKNKKDEIQREVKRIEECIEKRENMLKGLSEGYKRVESTLKAINDDIEIHKQIDSNFTIIKVEFENCKNYIKNFGHSVLEDEHILGLLPLEMTQGLSVLEQYKRYLSTEIAELEEKRKDLTVERFEDDYHRIEQVANRFLDNEKLNEGLIAARASLENKLTEKKKYYDTLFIQLKTDFSLQNEDDVSIGAEIEKALLGEEEMINKKKNDLKRREKEYRTKKVELDRLKKAKEDLEPLCTMEVDSSLELSQNMRTDRDIVAGLEIKIYEYEDDIYGLEGELRHLQGELGIAYKNTELVYRREQLEKERVELEKSYKEIDKAKLIERIKSLEEERVFAEMESRSYEEEVFQAKSKDNESQKKLLHISNEMQLLEKKCSTISRMEHESVKRLIMGKVVENIEALGSKIGEREKIIIEKITDGCESLVFNIFSVSTDSLTFIELKPTDAIEKELEQCRNVQKVSVNALSIYKNFLTLGKQKSQCPLCKTGLLLKDLTAFTFRLERVIAKLPESLLGARQKEESLTEVLKALSVENERIERENDIKAEITRLKGEGENIVINSVIEKFKYILRHLEEYPDRLGNKSTMKEDISYILSAAASSEAIEKRKARISSLLMRTFEIKSKIEEKRGLETKMDQILTELNKISNKTINMDDILSKIRHVESDLEARRDELSRMKDTLKKEEALEFKIEMWRKVNAARAEMKIIEEKMKDFNDLCEEEESLDQLEQEMAIEYDEHLQRKALSNVSIKELDVVRNQIIHITRELRCKEEEIRKREPIVGLEIFDKHIKGAIDAKGINECLYNARKALLGRKDEYIQVIKAIEKNKADFLSAEENIKLRRAKERILTIQKEINAYDFKKFENLKERQQHYEKKKSSIASSDASLRGELKQLNFNLVERKNEFSKDSAEIRRDYSKCVVQLRALELSEADVDCCVTALDHAIAEFHSLKVEEVNSTLRDLWAQTYKGNDIEYIELVAEISDQKAYSYGVMMIKNGSKMEMRGRCSAGQKMIASILIRLAIADSFSSNCNILALDEPTTNLDRANVESLAFTLGKLIRERVNMQLIVISHDEEFIEVLSREGVDYFYRLKRDINGSSHIEKHSAYTS